MFKELKVKLIMKNKNSIKIKSEEIRYDQIEYEYESEEQKDELRVLRLPDRITRCNNCNLSFQ